MTHNSHAINDMRSSPFAASSWPRYLLTLPMSPRQPMHNRHCQNKLGPLGGRNCTSNHHQSRRHQDRRMPRCHHRRRWRALRPTGDRCSTASPALSQPAPFAWPHGHLMTAALTPTPHDGFQLLLTDKAGPQLCRPHALGCSGATSPLAGSHGDSTLSPHCSGVHCADQTRSHAPSADNKNAIKRRTVISATQQQRPRRSRDIAVEEAGCCRCAG